MQYLVDEDPGFYTYNLYPAPNGLLPVGVTDNGDYIFWVVTDPHKSNDWTTAIIAARSPDVEYFNENLTELLAGILSGKIKADSFPNDFPDAKITFESL